MGSNSVKFNVSDIKGLYSQHKGFTRALWTLVFSTFHSSFFILPFSFFPFLFLVACDDYDTFTSDRSAVLRFDRDTVTFDTLLATVPSTTKVLSVHNLGDKGLRIREVRLELGAQSPFRVNVDGQDMTRNADRCLTDFEVRRRDSIIIRLEVTLPESGTDLPQPVSDALLFTLESGVCQRVALVAAVQDAIFLQHSVLTADTTFAASRPIVVRDSLVVGEGSTLTLAAGTQLYFHDGAGLTVRGRLVAQGTAEQPVVFRTDRTDRMFPYLPYDRLPARWQGIRIAPTSYENELAGIDLHGANYGIQCDAPANLSDKRTKLSLTNSQIHMIGGIGLSTTDARVVAVNTEVSNTLGHGVYVCGGDVSFTHCTLAQFYPLDANRGQALYISYDDSLGFHPLERADFLNCVVTGYADDVIIIPQLNRNLLPSDHSDMSINYVFDHCFLATVVPESTREADYAARFVDCVYEDKDANGTSQGTNTSNESDTSHEKNFLLFDTHAFLYDFTPVAESRIRGVADATRASLFSLDRLGRDRMADGKPDAGAYEGPMEEKKES